MKDRNEIMVAQQSNLNKLKEYRSMFEMQVVMEDAKDRGWDKNNHDYWDRLRTLADNKINQIEKFQKKSRSDNDAAKEMFNAIGGVL